MGIIDTMKLVSKLFMLSAVTLLGFTSAIDSLGKNCLDENTDLNTDKWDTNRIPVNETGKPSGEIADDARIPLRIPDIADVIDKSEDRLTDQLDTNDTYLRDNDFAQSISKITSPAVTGNRCYAEMCGPVTDSKRLLISVII